MFETCEGIVVCVGKIWKTIYFSKTPTYYSLFHSRMAFAFWNVPKW
jgi:hypothetical protein